MSAHEEREQRMADPAYAAAVRAAAGQAPPLTEEQRHTLGGIFHAAAPPAQARRTA